MISENSNLSNKANASELTALANIVAKVVFSGQATSVEFSVGTSNGNPSISIINADGTKRRFYVDIATKKLEIHSINTSGTTTNTITFTGS